MIRDAVIGGIATKVATSTTVRTNIANVLNKLSKKEMSALEIYIKSGGKDTVGKKIAEQASKDIKSINLKSNDSTNIGTSSVSSNRGVTTKIDTPINPITETAKKKAKGLEKADKPSILDFSKNKKGFIAPSTIGKDIVAGLKGIGE